MKKIFFNLIILTAFNLNLFAQNLITSSQVSYPASVVYPNQICFTISNVPYLNSLNQQVFYVDSVGFNSSNYLMIYSRDSTYCSTGPFTLTNYTFCVNPPPIGVFYGPFTNYQTGICSTPNSQIYLLGLTPFTVLCPGVTVYDTIDLIACQYLFYNNQGYFNNTFVNTTYTNTIGCDSIVTARITINQTSPITVIHDTICSGFTKQIGNSIYNSTGIYIDSFSNQFGCDSVVELKLVVKPSFNNTISQVGSSLFANQQNVTYQWYNCTLNQIVNSETSQFYTPNISGSYAVICNNGICSDTSNCKAFTITSNNSVYNNDRIIIYPNPNNGCFYFENLIANKIEITNTFGQLIPFEYEKSIREIKLSNNSSGIYFLKIFNITGKVFYQKINVIN
jgi:hypothetical protein